MRSVFKNVKKQLAGGGGERIKLLPKEVKESLFLYSYIIVISNGGAALPFSFFQDEVGGGRKNTSLVMLDSTSLQPD